MTWIDSPRRFEKIVPLSFAIDNTNLFDGSFLAWEDTMEFIAGTLAFNNLHVNIFMFEWYELI